MPIIQHNLVSELALDILESDHYKKTNSDRDQNNYKPSLRKLQLSSKALILKHDEYITDATDLLNEINLTKYCKGVKYNSIWHYFGEILEY